MLLYEILIFLAGFALMWFASGLVIRGVERFSKDTNIPTFVSSFLILGVLTSLTEISVGLNSLLDGKPSIFVGNLIGGSFVILMLIIPLLAIWSNGITLRHRLEKKRLLFFLVLIAAPSFVILDGQVSTYDGWLLLVLYVLFLNLFQSAEHLLDKFNRDSVSSSLWKDLGKITAGAVLIFISGKILVDKTIVLADALHVSPMLVSLLLLSIGTNIPELTIALRSIRLKHKEIAFGDYIGSASTNVLLFAVLTLAGGSFSLELAGFTPVFFIIIAGYVLFFIFARMKNRISPAEGLILILVFLAFLLFQGAEIVFLSPDI